MHGNKTDNSINYFKGEQIERVNQLLSKFVGTHNFHNFTSGK